MQLYEILCVSETNSVAILLYMTSACVRVRYSLCGELGLVRIGFRKPSGVETLTVLEVPYICSDA
jgi:hypothetical protein